MSDDRSQIVDTSLPAWDGAVYAGNTGHHRVQDEWFLDGLPIAPTDRVLDIGCGAGDFTATVASMVPDGHVVGLDAQPSMVAEARRRAGPNQSFVVATAQRLGDALAGEASFDLVISRATLHWVPWADMPGVLAGVAAVLRPGGWFRVECGGGDNIPAVRPLVDDVSERMGGPVTPWSFMPAGAWLELLERHSFDVGPPGHVRTVAQRRAFDETTVWGWFTSQAAQAYEVGRPAAWAQEFRAAVRARLGEIRRTDGTWDQTFVRADFLVRR